MAADSSENHHARGDGDVAFHTLFQKKALARCRCARAARDMVLYYCTVLYSMRPDEATLKQRCGHTRGAWAQMAGAIQAFSDVFVRGVARICEHHI